MNYKIIPLYPAYEISNCGKSVRRISNKKEVRQGKQVIKGKETGYLYVSMCYGANDSYLTQSKRVAVHRLVALAWLPEPKENQVWVNHKDGIKSNNDYLNLEWTTISENIQHAYNTGLKVSKKGKEHHKYGTKLTLKAKALMSEAKKGAKHPKFKGYYFAKWVKYESATQAAKVLNTNSKTIINRCKNPKFKNDGYYFVPVNTNKTVNDNQ